MSNTPRRITRRLARSHPPTRPPIVHLFRLLLLLGMLVPQLPFATALAAPVSAPVTKVADAPAPKPLTQAACPAGPSGLPDVVDRTNFCVRYDDADTTLAQATQVADITQQYWDRYTTDFGFATPAFTDKLVVEIRDDASCNGATGAGVNYLYVYNGCFANPESIQKVTGHELFHRVQYSYDGDEVKWFKEGTARATEDLAFANIDHWADTLVAVSSSFNKQVNTYLQNTNVDITSEPQRYNSALWWKYFTEQFGSVTTEPQRGIDAMLALWQAAATQDDIAALNSALGTLGAGQTFDSAFRRFAAANWIKDLTNQPDGSFNYLDEDEAGNGAPYGPVLPINGGTISAGSPATFNNQALSRYGANYYSATPGANCPVISVSFNTDNGPAFYHVVTQKGNALDSHFESSASPWTQSFFNDGITRVVAIAGATNNSAQADISIQCLNPVIDIRMPNSGAVAKVGPFDGPGKFLAQVLVTNGDPKGPVVAGLTVNDFKARVNGVNALITAGGFVQEQYWLVIQAPNQGANGLYDLEIRLEESGTATTIATDTNTASVEYTPDNIDQVLVIDRSGSMASDGKMQAARDAANFYVDITRNNDGLSLVPFDHNVSPAPFAMQLVDLFVRNNAHNFINALSTGGATSIGDGMNEAVNQRTGSPTGNPLCSYVLLSDGMENSSLYWSDVAAAVQATACPVTTIAFGSAADETLMEQIATTTGGAFFYNDVYVSAVNAAGVDAAAAINAADTALDLADTYEYANALAEGRQRLLDEKGTLPGNAAGGPNNAEREHRVLIDGSVKEALFALKWDQGGCQEFCPQLALRLVSPDGKEYTEKSIAYTFKNTYSGHLGWRIPSPVAGEWRIFVSYADGSVAPNGAAYKVIVSADSLLTAHLLLPAKRKLTGLFMPIFALVSGEKPIGDASVRAVVIAPDGTRTVVPLYDDGDHDDGLPGDGFYGGVYKRVNQAEPVPPIREEGGEKLPDPRDEGSYRVELQVYHAQFQRQALGSFSVLEAPDANDNRLPDTYEEQNGLTSPDGDNDLDWLDNYSEYLLGTDANNSDTDGSGENDGSEVEKQKNPFSEKDDSIEAPTFVDATADVNSVRIHFDVKPGYHHMILYRAESPNGPWQLRDQEVPPTGEYIDKEVKNGQGYWYKMMAVDEKNHRSAVVASQGVVPSADPFAPEARILINNGAPTTTDLLVKLSFVPYEEDDYYGDIAEMRVSNRADLSDAEWQPFAKEMDWQLAETKPGDMAQVYARFRDKAGNESLLETARIRYESSGATTCVDPNPRAGAVKFGDVPVQFVRIAAQLLADMRGGPMAPGWEKAHFAELVRELYRPDIEGVAYYEFQVLNGEEKPAGFIIVATGEHDHPIPHWNYEGETPTQHVACEAAKNDKKVTKFFKLDTLSYAGEDENGELAAMPGTPLIKVSGLTMDMLDKEQEISSSEWTPNQETQSDDEAGDIDGTLTERGPTPPENLTLEGWDSWQELKKGYGETYAVFIEALKREAAEDWETDQLAREHGEGLFKGKTYDISLLIPGTPQVQMSGEGAGYVDFEVVSESGQPAVLRIHVKDAKPGEALPLIATVDYATVNAASVSNGMTLSAGQETITFAVLDSPTTVPGNGAMNKIYLPLVNGGGQPQVSAASAAAVNGAWSNWHYFWAGSHNDQRLYNQIEKHTGPNTSGCWSGCGGTAWAMLFGWADKQAANGNSYWASRWGLYRQNGGKGSDAVAPRNMDSGVMNMTWEIRNDVGTWCWGDSGPTNPWDMDNASNYFSGRTGTRLSTHYNVLGISESRLRNYARDSIVDRNTPAVIGTGWLTHYPLAYGYAWRSRTVQKCFIWCWTETEYNRAFYVNQGWGGSDNGWVTASTWFAGEIRP